MLKVLISMIVLMICNCHLVCAQVTWEDWKLDVGDDESLSEWKTQYEELADLSEHPFNINTVTKEELELLPFLSDKLIENILYYVYKYGPLVSKNELLGVEGMDWQTRSFLQDFIYIGPSDNEKDNLYIKNVFKYGKQELLTRFDIPFNQKAGYADYSEETLEKNPDKKNLGSPVYHNIRYKFQYGQRVFFGLTAEKDAGEPFFVYPNRKGYDYYGFYLQLQDISKIKSLVVGNYKAGFGYGLVINMNNFSLGKYVTGNGLRMGKGLSKHASVDEFHYLHGVGITYRLDKRWNLSAFYSYRRMDGNVDGLFIRTLKTDGLHRLPKENEKRKVFNNHLIGSNLTYNGKFMEYGLTVVYNKFNKMLNPDFRPYNKYYPRGDYFFNAGGFYKFFLNKFTFSGETAIDKNGRLAMLHILNYSPDVDNTFVFMNRYYDMKFQTLYGKSFGENSRMQNESGFYLGLESNTLPNMKLSGYVDVFHFPYLRYRVDKVHTTGFDASVQISYTPVSSLAMLIKYSCKDKPLNHEFDNGNKYVLPDLRHRLHYGFSYNLDPGFLFKTSLEYIRTGFYKSEKSNGMYLSETMKMDIPSFPVKLSLSSAWFSTEDTSSRVYVYEPGLLYSFSMYSFYGKGCRHALNVIYQWKDRLSLHSKLGWTHYRDRNEIGTGLETIHGNNKLDLQLQLKLKW